MGAAEFFNDDWMVTRHDGFEVHMQNLYTRASAFLVLGGPSLQYINAHDLYHPGVLTVGINNSVTLVRPDIWVALDPPYRFVMSAWMDPKILKIAHVGDAHTRMLRRHITLSELPNILYVDRLKLNAASEGIRCTMYASLRILFYLGIRRVFLVGCDFNMTSDRPYAFKQSVDDRSVRWHQSKFAIMDQLYRSLAPEFISAGLQVFNCTEGSKLTAFPYKPLQDALYDVKHLEASTHDFHAETTEGLYQ